LAFQDALQELHLIQALRNRTAVVVIVVVTVQRLIDAVPNGIGQFVSLVVHVQQDGRQLGPGGFDGLPNGGGAFLKQHLPF
jgi:hypothetical protein